MKKILSLILIVILCVSCSTIRDIRFGQPKLFDASVMLVGYEIGKKLNQKDFIRVNARCDEILVASDTDASQLFSDGVVYIVDKYTDDPYISIILENCLSDLQIEIDKEKKEAILADIALVREITVLFKEGLNRNIKE